MVDGLTPEPRSLQAKLTRTSWFVHVPPLYGLPSPVLIAMALTVGALLSTFMPLIGPAVAQFPARSHTWRVPVEAFAVSLPFGTLVDSVKLASDRLARPEPESAAAQVTLWSSARQAPSVEPQLTVGGVVSTTNVSLTSALRLPAGSAALTVKVCEPSLNPE